MASKNILVLCTTPDISLDPRGLLELLHACSAWMAAERHSVLQSFVYLKTTLLAGNILQLLSRCSIQLQLSKSCLL